MKNNAIKLALYINYFVFAILLNSVGIVILKSIKNFGVDEVQASTLELFKDMPIAIVSFLIASFLPRIGYKRSMLIGLAIVTFATISMYFGNSFTSAQILFASVGVSFALIKVSVYSVIGLVTDGEKEHNSLMSSIEGVFMFGIALAYFLFPAFNTEGQPDAWLRVYWVLAGLSILSFLFLFFAKNDAEEVKTKEDILFGFKGILRLTLLSIFVYFLSDYSVRAIQLLFPLSWFSGISILIPIYFILLLKIAFVQKIVGNDVVNEFKVMGNLILKLLVFVFVISAFLFVMIEQGIMTWLPTFNERVLNYSDTLSDAVTENISIKMSAILAISLGVGRILAGVISKKVSWVWIVATCIVAAMGIVLFILPKVVSAEAVEIFSFSDIPLMAYTFPLVGLFLAPIYPLLNSAVLSAIPKRLHSPMTGLIVVFSALGGTLGSRAIGWLFKTVGAETAFYYTLIPMGLLLIALFLLKNLTEKEAANG